jgi:hypothetical protein
MHRRSLGRASALATVAVLAVAGLASADSVLGDANITVDGTQGARYLGQYPASTEITVPVEFVMTCVTTNHPDLGQTVTLALGSASVTGPGGEVVSMVPATIGPIPAAWPDDLSGCPSPVPSLRSTTGQLTLRTPSAGGLGYTYDIMFSRELTPMGNNDGAALGLRDPAVTFTLDVVANTPPVLTVAPDVTVEADTAGGWTVDWAGIVSATDAEDDPDPAFDCSLDPGQTAPLGATTVTCDTTDSGALAAEAEFVLHVEDTGDPTIADHADVQVTTGDPTGAVVTFEEPAATDVVDTAVAVDCDPASGSSFAAGTTPVTCTATDDSGNTASTTFDVTVDYVPSHTASATWGEPVGVADGGTFAANRGRNLPVKVTLVVDGVTRTTGVARLSIAPCGGGAGSTLPLTYNGGRWNGAIDTGPLPGWCHTVTATIDGLTAGTFQLDLRGGEATKAKPKGK